MNPKRIRHYLEKSTAASGVPLKVADESAIRHIAKMV